MSGERRYLAERIRVALAKKNWSGAALARALDVSRAAVACWLQGDNEPRDLHKVAHALGVTVSWLLSPHPVDLHGPATDDMRDTLIGLHVAGVLTEGQVQRATGLDRVEIRTRAHARAEQFFGANNA